MNLTYRGALGYLAEEFRLKLIPTFPSEHFVYSTYQVTWEQATNFCSWGGMTLAHAVSPEENVALVKLARESSPIDDLGAKHPYLNRNWVRRSKTRRLFTMVVLLKLMDPVITFFHFF